MTTNTFSTIKSTSIKINSPSVYTQRTVAMYGTSQTISNYFGGGKVISGWIRDPSAVPKRYKITLCVWPHSTVIAHTYSDASNGVGNNYFFNNLVDLTNSDERFTVSVEEPELLKTARIKDNLIAI